MLLSLLFVAFVVLKVAEGWGGLEAWPLSNVSMFCDRRPVDVVPKRARLVGVRKGETVELTGADFRLSEDEFNTRLRDDNDLAKACRELVQSYNRRLARRGRSEERLTAAFAERTEILRPGIARAPWRIDADCLEPAATAPPGNR